MVSFKEVKMNVFSPGRTDWCKGKLALKRQEITRNRSGMKEKSNLL
jgi:hypothetical protein